MNNKTDRQKMYESLMEQDHQELIDTNNTHERLLEHIQTFKKAFDELYKIIDSVKYNTDSTLWRSCGDKIKQTLDENEVLSYELFTSIYNHYYLFTELYLPKDIVIFNHYISTIITSYKGMTIEFKKMKEHSKNVVFYDSFVYFDDEL